MDDLSHAQEDHPECVTSSDVRDTNGSFQRVEVEYDNLADGSANDTATSTTRTSMSANNADVEPSYGYNAQFKLAVLVYDADGAVVDTRVVTDTADGVDP